MQTAYIIKCEKGPEMCNRIGFLLRKGMVFTSCRDRDFLDIKATFLDFMEWKFIFIGHKECKRVFNTSAFHGDYYHLDNVNLVDIAWDDFVRDVLPTL